MFYIIFVALSINIVFQRLLFNQMFLVVLFSLRERKFSKRFQRQERGRGRRISSGPTAALELNPALPVSPTYEPTDDIFATIASCPRDVLSAARGVPEAESSHAPAAPWQSARRPLFRTTHDVLKTRGATVARVDDRKKKKISKIPTKTGRTRRRAARSLLYEPYGGI